MQRILVNCLALLATVLVIASNVGPANAQMGGPGGYGGRSGGRIDPSEEIANTPRVDKPDAVATKAYKAGVKSLAKAKDQENAAAKAPNEDKKNAALEKMNDAYGRALDQFTEALISKGDMYEAWDKVGDIHLHFGAYAESIDDYNHAIALQPGLLEAIERRAEAYVAVDRLDEAKIAYMDLFNHDRKLADQLMLAMQQWLTDHQANARGMRASDVDAFGKWLQERDGIAKQASLPP